MSKYWVLHSFSFTVYKTLFCAQSGRSRLERLKSLKLWETYSAFLVRCRQPWTLIFLVHPVTFPQNILFTREVSTKHTAFPVNKKNKQRTHPLLNWLPWTPPYLCSQLWFPTVQEVLHADWQDVWHSPQPPFFTVLFRVCVFNVFTCFITTFLLVFLDFYKYSIFLSFSQYFYLNR